MSETKIANLAGTQYLETYDLQMVFPGTNKPTGWVVTLAGPAHPQSIELSNETTRERLKKSADIERAQVNGRKYKGDEDTDPEESNLKTVSGIVRRIVTWSPVDFGNGPIEFSKKAATDLFMDRANGAYLGQIVDYLTAERAFIKGSAPI